MDLKKRRFAAIVGTGILSLVVLIAASIFGGQIRLDDRMLIQGVGVDVQGDEVLVSVHISQPVEQGEIQLQQVQGSTVLEALNKLVQKSGKTPLYSHNMVVVFGKSCGEDGLEKFLDFFVRYYEARPSVHLFMAQGEAREVFELQKDGKYTDTEDLARIAHSGDSNGWTVNTRVIDFVNQLKGEGSSPYLPILAVEEEDVQAVGTALFQEDRYCAELSPEESRVLLLVTKYLSGGQLVVQMPQAGKVTMAFQSSQVSLESGIQEGVPVFTVKADCEMEISSMGVIGGSSEGEETFSQLEEAAEKQLKESIRQTLDKTLREYQTDPFGFGRLLFQQQTHWWKQEGEHWKEWMQKVEFALEVEVRINRVEQELSPLQ